MSDESSVFEKIPVGVGGLLMLRADNINDSSGINIVLHFHMMDELMWFRESGGSYSIGDEKFIIKNNTLVYVPAPLIHEMALSPAASCKRYLMQLEKGWLEGYDLPLPATRCDAVVYFSGKETERLELLLSWCSEFSGSSDLLFRSLI